MRIHLARPRVRLASRSSVSRLNRLGSLAIAAVLALAPASSQAAGARLFKSSPIQITADGAWVWTANTDDNSVSRLETATDTVTRYPLVGCTMPEGLAVREDGAEVIVACRESDRLIVLTGLGPSAGTPLANIELPLGSGPLGIALAPDQRHAAVTLSRLPGAALIDVPARSVAAIFDHLESTPIGVAWTEDGLSAWITHLRRYADMTFLTRMDISGPTPTIGTELTILPAGPLRSGSLTDPDPAKNVAEGGYLTFRGALAQVPSITGRNELWIPTQYTDVHEDAYPSPPDSTAQSSIRHFLLGPKTLPETITDKVIISAAQIHAPGGLAWTGPGWDAHVAGPVDIGFSADGQTACVLHEVSGDLVVMPTSTPAYKPDAATPPLPEIAVGSRPTGFALSPVNDLAYVLNRLGDPTNRVAGRTVSVVDLVGLTELRQVSVAPETFSPQHLLGARIFHSSDDPRISAKQKGGCATCHPGGEEDSSQWDMNVLPGASGPRMVPSLLGLSLTFANGEHDVDHGYGLLHHSGDRDEVQDFDFTFSGGQLGGTGFLGAARNVELGPPNAGLSPELDALEEYVLSLPPIPRSPHRDPSGTLTEAALRGATFFMGSDPTKSADAGCGTCHDPRSAFVDHRFHDVGQGRSFAEEELNNRNPPWQVKTQTLMGLWATTPYEGTANIRGQSRDIMEFFKDIRGSVAHGRIDSLTGKQVRDLAEFVLSIDGMMTPDEVLLARDNVPPHLDRVEPVSLSMIDAWFDESIDPVSASNVSNWTVTDETGANVPVTAATVDAQNGDLVRLSVTLRAGCPPATYTVMPGAIFDIAASATGGVPNVVNALDPRNTRTFTISDTITITLGSSGYENLTIPVHDSGTGITWTWSWEYPRLAGAVFGTPPVPNRGFVRFDWEEAFMAATALPSSADILDASFSLQPEAGDAHDVNARRVLLYWQDNTTIGSTPPAGSLTNFQHFTPAGPWNATGASKMTAGVDGDDPADYDRVNDISATIDATAIVRSVKERTQFSGPGVTAAYRFWFDNPAVDYGHALELTAGSVRELDYGRFGPGLFAPKPVLTLTYHVQGGQQMPPEVSGPVSAFPMLLSKASAAGDSILVSFEDLAGRASTYALYAGNIGTWYSHASAACGVTPLPTGGRREVTLAVPEPARYFLATAENGCAEGPSGANSFGVAHPVGGLDCAP